MPVFGMFDRFLGRSDSDGDDEEEDSVQKYQILARDRNGQAAETPDVVDSGEWVYEDERPDKEWFKYEYGRHLKAGVRYVCVPLDGRRPNFDDIQWTVEPDGRARGEEMPEWARELHAQMQERPATDDLDILLVREIAQQEGPREALQEFKQLKALESGDHGARLSESVEDPTDAKEIAGRGFLKMSENYSSFGEMFEDVLGGALSGASQMPAAGPQAQTNGQQAAQQPPQGQAQLPNAAEGAPEPQQGQPQQGQPQPRESGRGGRSSSLRAQFEQEGGGTPAADDASAPIEEPAAGGPASSTGVAEAAAPTDAPDPEAAADDAASAIKREEGDPQCHAISVSTEQRCGNPPRKDGVLCKPHANMDPDAVTLVDGAPTPPTWAEADVDRTATTDDGDQEASDDRDAGDDGQTTLRREGPGTASGAGAAPAESGDDPTEDVAHADGGDPDGDAPTVEVDGGQTMGDPVRDGRPMSASPHDSGGDEA